MLTKQDIIDRLRIKQYPQNEYWVTAGAGLVIHGIKQETRDIDLGCSSLLADLLIREGAKWQCLENGTRKINAGDDIEIFENWFVDSITKIDGLCVATAESIRKQKAELNRTKDWEDIALIDKFMSNK